MISNTLAVDHRVKISIFVQSDLPYENYALFIGGVAPIAAGLVEPEFLQASRDDRSSFLSQYMLAVDLHFSNKSLV